MTLSELSQFYGDHKELLGDNWLESQELKLKTRKDGETDESFLQRESLFKRHSSTLMFDFAILRQAMNSVKQQLEVEIRLAIDHLLHLISLSSGIKGTTYK